MFYLINTFSQQRCIQLIKSDSKGICNLTKDFYFNERLSKES